MMIFTKLFIQNDYLTFYFYSWPTWGQYSFSHLPLPQLHFPSNLFILHHPWIYSPFYYLFPFPVCLIRIVDENFIGASQKRVNFWCHTKLLNIAVAILDFWISFCNIGKINNHISLNLFRIFGHQ